MDVMKKALNAKFTQHNFLKRKLVDTGSRTLVERSPYDSFWGDGGDGSGLNHLGSLLMELRSKLQSVNLSSNEVQRDCVNRPVHRQMSDSSVPARSSNTTACEIRSTGAGPHSKGVGGGLPPGNLTRRPIRSTSDPGNEENKGGGASQENEVPTENLIDLSDGDNAAADKHRQMPAHMQHGNPNSHTPATLGVNVRGVASSYDAMQVDKPREGPSNTEGEPMDTEDSH